MSILESKSESFLEYIKSLQKGKGKVISSLHRSAPHPFFQAISIGLPAEIPEDFEVTTLPEASYIRNGFLPRDVSAAVHSHFDPGIRARSPG